MKHLRNLGTEISISIPPDEFGYTGRECPEKHCEGYFKVKNGTGLKGAGIPCYCPYCGYSGSHNKFFTKAQIEYVKSMVMRKVSDALHQDLKSLEFEHKPKGGFGIGLSLKVQPGTPIPIHFYREKTLETEVVCSNCTLQYAVYGVFAVCPDCGKHNSLQILEKNIEIVGKMLELALELEGDISEKLIENALEDCVSAFDGFGREVCKIYASKASNPAKAEKIRFQSLELASAQVLSEFNFDLSAAITSDLWKTALHSFQKRHLLAHKMGVVDQDYLNKSGDVSSVVGRKVKISPEDVKTAMETVQQIGHAFLSHLEA